MKILILGAGVAGITTAYFLSKRGHDVTVIDREAESAQECSFANGGQLSYCHAEPWASPSSLKKAIKWLGKEDAPLRFRFRADADMWRWTLRFLRQCTTGSVQHSTQTMLRLGLYSREVMHRLDDELKLDFDYCKRGILHIFPDAATEAGFRRQSEFQETLGAPYEILTTEALLEKEPALSHLAPHIYSGAIYPLDESADIFKFTHALAEWESHYGQGVHFQFHTEITKLITEGTRITAVETSRGTQEADCVIMALGAYSPLLLRPIGIRVPIYPMKGYSISIPVTNPAAAPEISITDHADKVVFSRLGEILRVAGTAEFAGYDHSIDPGRITMLKRIARQYFPEAGDIENAEEWACLRPSTPAGPPVLGRTKYTNLLLNTGHGTLGWTQAAGSARIVSDLVEQETPEIPLDDLTLPVKQGGRA